MHADRSTQSHSEAGAGVGTASSMHTALCSSQTAAPALSPVVLTMNLSNTCYFAHITHKETRLNAAEDIA